MDLKQELRNLGLSKSEIEVYLFLLETGISSPARIAKGTKIARTNTYHLLNSLEEGGLIAKQQKGKRFVYVANDPSATVRMLERRRETMEKVLPDLRALFLSQRNKPIIKFYEDRNSFEEIFMQTLEAKEILGMTSLPGLYPLTPAFHKKYNRLLRERGIVFRDILSAHTDIAVARDAREAIGPLYEHRFLRPEQKVYTNMLLWGDTVAMFAPEEPVFGTVITNADFAKTFRTFFETLWNSLEGKG